MYFYTAYGLSIRSTFPFPELTAGGRGDDVFIHLQKTPDLPDAPLWHLEITSCKIHLATSYIGHFHIHEGREIAIQASPEADDRLIRSYTMGVVMALLLYQRGYFTLHASAVQINGRAIAFAGAPGAGKSSIAAALHARGHPVIADDLVAIPPDPTRFAVVPGFPQLKLSPQVASLLKYPLDSLRLLHPAEEKRGLRTTMGFPREPIPLQRIYVLTEEDSLEVHAPPPRERVIELIRHSYPTRLQYAGDASHLQRCAELAAAVPIYRLQRPRQLTALPKLAQLIEEHLVDDEALQRVPNG